MPGLIKIHPASLIGAFTIAACVSFVSYVTYRSITRPPADTEAYSASHDYGSGITYPEGFSPDSINAAPLRGEPGYAIGSHYTGTVRALWGPSDTINVKKADLGRLFFFANTAGTKGMLKVKTLTRMGGAAFTQKGINPAFRDSIPVRK